MPDAPPSFRPGWYKPPPKQGHPDRIRGRKLQRLRAQVFMEEPLCRMCAEIGLVSPSEELDHVVPLSSGGGNERANLQALCKPCHASKTAGERMGALSKSGA
jgi:5-methylcytosine-specific restriction protein A